MKTKVFITIDTEFSIGGAFADPVRYQPIGEQAVLCEVDGTSHGLGFILDTLAEFGIAATFFVETFNTYFFGDPPMRDLARRIQAANHDLQLHLHPCWTYFKGQDWIQRLQVTTPTDHMNGRSLVQLVEWFNDGIAIFERWGLDRPTALRTGNLITDRVVYKAMEACGLKVGSNVALGVFRPQEPELQLYSGLQQIGKVLEACVLTYIDREIGSHVYYRSLTITGSSWAETRALLQSAHSAAIESLVILTHPFEFVKKDSPAFTNMLPNQTTQRRLRKLCAFLAKNDDCFEVATIGQLASRTAAATRTADTPLKAPWLPVAARMLENFLSDHLRAF